MRLRRRARGFGLLEVMISGSILLVGITAVVSTINHIESIHRHQRLLTQAVHVGEGTLEELLGRWNDDPELAINTTTIGPVYDSTGRVFLGIPPPSGPPLYATSWSVVPGPIPAMRTIIVTVAWVEDGANKTFVVQGSRS